MSTKLVQSSPNTATGRHPEEKAPKVSRRRELLEEEQGTPATEQDVIDKAR
jgi:hypothetical protein